jgi:hypothetical protein
MSLAFAHLLFRTFVRSKIVYSPNQLPAVSMHVKNWGNGDIPYSCASRINGHFFPVSGLPVSNGFLVFTKNESMRRFWNNLLNEFADNLVFRQPCHFRESAVDRGEAELIVGLDANGEKDIEDVVMNQ